MYELNPINNNPLMQNFPVEQDKFEGLIPKANAKLPVIGKELEVADVYEIATEE